MHDVDNGSIHSQFSAYAQIHEAGNQLQIHKSPLFLPWHRALVLDLERQLQNIDPRVTLPYWRFDRPAPKVFADDFMGVTKPDVPFKPGPPLARWIDLHAGKLVRDPALDPSNGVLDGAIPESFNPNFVIFHGQIESQFHSGVHSRLGGWLATPFSPSDPLFFLLHANVDRVWAHWQARFNHFDPDDERAYSSQGAFPGNGEDKGIYAPGVYSEDQMWPWGSPPGGAPGTQYWPVLNHPMPDAGNNAPAVPITPRSVVDYLNVRGTGLALGYCYDDIDFLGHEATDLDAGTKG